MADNDKLWFDMGIRQGINRDLDRLMSRANELQKAFSIALKGNLSTGFRESYENAAKLKEAFVKIDNALKNIRTAKIAATDPQDIANLNRMSLELGRLRRQLDDFGNKMKADPKFMKQSGLVDAFLLKNGFGTAMMQVRSYTASVNEAADAERRMGIEMVQAFDKAAEKGGRFRSITDQIMTQVAATLSLAGIKNILNSVIRIGGEFEVQHIALQSILGDLNQANSIFGQIKRLAVVSPFNFSQLVTYSKQLAAYNIPYEEMYDTTKRLADMSAGLGVDMSRLILAYGQVRSAAVLRGQELRQFTEAGIPLVQALADEFTKLNGRIVTTGEVFGLISKRAVPFEMVKKILWEMTDEGGRFFNMQFTLADTLSGKWSNLVDAWEIMLSEFAKGEGLVGRFLKGGVQTVTDLVEGLGKASYLISGVGTALLAHGVGKSLLTRTNMLGDVGLKSQIRDAQNLYAIKLRQQLVQKEITMTEYKSKMVANQNVEAWKMQLAYSGRLNAMQLRNLYLEKGKNAVLLQEWTTMGLISARMQAAILSGNALKVAFLSAGTALKSMFGPIGWIMIAFDAIVATVTSLVMRQQKFTDDMNEASRTFATSARDRADELSKSLEGYDKKAPTTEDDYRNSIDAMKEQLKQYDANYASIMREVDGIGTLQGKYEKLKEELGYVRDSYQAAGERKGWFENLYKAEQDLIDGSDKWSEANNKLNRSLVELASEGGEKLKGMLEQLYKGGLLKGGAPYDKKPADILRDWTDRMSSRELEEARASLSKSTMQGYGEYNFEKIKKYRSFFSVLNETEQEDLRTYLGDAIRRQHEYDKIRNEVYTVFQQTYKLTATQLGIGADALRQKMSEEGNNIDQRTKTLFRQNYMNAMSALTQNNTELMRWIDAQVWPLYVHYEIHSDYQEAEGGLMGAALFAKGKVGDLLTDQQLKEAFGNEDDIVKGKKYIKKLVDEKKELYDTAKQMYGEDAKATKDAENEYKNVRTAKNILFPGEKEKGAGGAKKDTQLEELKDRVDLYKKFYSELENATKMYGRKGGLDFLKENGFSDVFSWGLSDVSNYKQSLNELTDGFNANTKAREKFLNSTDADIVAKKRKDEADAMKEYVSELQRMMSVMSENYQTYKKWVDLTGDTELAARIAGVTQNTSYSDYLTDLMQKELNKKENARYSAMTAADVFGMKETDARKLGKDNPMFGLWEEWQKNQQKIRKDQLELYEEAIKNSKSYEDKIADINRNLRQEINNIKEMKISQAEKDRLIQQRTDNANEDIAKQRWEQFKDENNWGEIFGDLDRLTTNTINQMIVKMEELLPSIKEDETAVKELYNALDKMRKEYSERNPIGTMFNSIRQSSRLSQLQKDVLSKRGSFTPDSKSAKYYGLKEGETYTSEEIQDKIKNISSNFVEGLKGLTAGFKSVEDVLSPVVKLFDTLGDTTISEGLNIGGEALGAASQVAGGLQSLGLEKLGPYGAAAAAGLSVVTSIFALHDKALQREIEASQARQKGMENLTENLQTVLERTLGSIYGATTGESIINSLINEIRNPYKGWAEWKADLFDVDNTSEYRSYLKKETIDAVKNAEQTKKYYDAAYASLLAQRDELVHQMNSEKEKKNSDSDKLADYRQQITEMEDQIKYFAQDMAKDLWDIDVKSWAQELTDTIVDAWKNGEDAVDAYKNKVKEMMLDLTTNILSQKVMEKMLDEIGLDDLIVKLMKNTKGELDANAVTEIAEKLNTAAEESTETILAILDKMEQSGYISKGDEDTASSRNAIGKAITEQDTSLWSSYLNAIRADVSVNRVTLTQILSVIQSTSEMPVIARAQLEQLQQIAVHTGRNASLVEEIRNLLNGNINGTNQFRIK